MIAKKAQQCLLDLGQTLLGNGLYTPSLMAAILLCSQNLLRRLIISEDISVEHMEAEKVCSPVFRGSFHVGSKRTLLQESNLGKEPLQNKGKRQYHESIYKIFIMDVFFLLTVSGTLHPSKKNLNENISSETKPRRKYMNHGKFQAKQGILGKVKSKWWWGPR